MVAYCCNVIVVAVVNVGAAAPEGVTVVVDYSTSSAVVVVVDFDNLYYFYSFYSVAMP